MVLSPDGETIAFGAGATSSGFSPSARGAAEVASRERRARTFPFWSPDGAIDRASSPAESSARRGVGRARADVCDAPIARGGTWGAGGRHRLRSGHSRRGSAGRGRGRRAGAVTRVDEKRHTTHRWPFFLPDGKHFLYLGREPRRIPARDQAGIYVASLDGKENRRLLPTLWERAVLRRLAPLGSGREPDGAAASTPRSLTLSGESVRIADDVNFDDGVWRGNFTHLGERGARFSDGRGGRSADNSTWIDDRPARQLATIGDEGRRTR